MRGLALGRYSDLVAKKGETLSGGSGEVDSRVGNLRRFMRHVYEKIGGKRKTCALTCVGFETTNQDRNATTMSEATDLRRNTDTVGEPPKGSN